MAFKKRLLLLGANYNHRYSDDLDFFVNNSKNYDEQLNMVLTLLNEACLTGQR